MDLVDRYLHAVGFWLPKDRKDDILRELGEDLRSEMDEKESGLGRPISVAEVEALLKSRGRPYQAAARYLPTRHLIGPALFPMYIFALKLAGWIALGVGIVLPFALSFLLPGRLPSPAKVLTGSLDSLWHLALTWFALITLGFAIAESAQGRSSVSRDWSPSRLPKVKGTRRVSRASSIAEMLFGALFFYWWLGALRFPGFLARNGEPLSLPPSGLWQDLRGRFLVPIAVVMLAGVVLAVFNLVRPQLSRLRIGARAALDALSAGLLSYVLFAHKVEIRAALKGLKGTLEGAAKLEALRNWALANVLIVIAIGGFISCVVGLVRLARKK